LTSREAKNLEIRRLSLIEGARKAEGLAVVIDVFRAFTTAAHVMANGAKRILPVGTVEEAFELRKLHPEWVLIGEEEGKKVEGFDYGNSPYDISVINFSGKTIVQRTGAGTQGVVNARKADTILLGSFVMAGAIIKYIQKNRPDIVSMIAMGDRGVSPNIEDESCAEYIVEGLRGHSPNYGEIKRRISKDPSGRKFFDSARLWFRENDFHLALELDRFNFVLLVEREDYLYVKKVFP
jgi:2-phosphosulfolactate phosphatase